MVLFQGGNFLQVLEGEKSVVEKQFEIIKYDPRHYQVMPLLTRRDNGGRRLCWLQCPCCFALSPVLKN
jgi:hypothetical protein